MNQQNRSLVLFVVSIVGFLTVLGVGIYVTLQQGNQVENAPFTPVVENEPADSKTPTEHGVTTNLYLTNIAFLAKWFNEIEYLFINDSVVNYAAQGFPNASGLTIDETSFTQQSASSYGFSVKDSASARLFYVTVVRTPSGQLNINFYNS